MAHLLAKGSHIVEIVEMKTRHDGEFTVAQYSNDDHLMMIFDEKYMNTDKRLKMVYLECFIMRLIHVIDKGMGALKLFFYILKNL